MPIYEFRCLSCQRKFSTLIGMTSEPDDTRCPHCASENVSRLVSRFLRLKTEDDRIDEMSDRLESGGEPENTAKARELVRELGKAMDDDMADDMEELFEEDMENPDEEPD